MGVACYCPVYVHVIMSASILPPPQVDLLGDAPVFKEGQIMRKNVMEGPHKKGTVTLL